MSERKFFPGDRVEFWSLTNANRLFRGVVQAKLRGGYYHVVHEGERKGRLVNGDRLRRCVTVIGGGRLV